MSDKPSKWWRIDDLRTGENIVVDAATEAEAMQKFLDCCAENALLREADAMDLELWGPGSGCGWYQD